MLLFSSLVGCSNTKPLPQSGYEMKQIRCGNLETTPSETTSLETTYVVCKQCIDFTKIKHTKKSKIKEK